MIYESPLLHTMVNCTCLYYIYTRVWAQFISGNADDNTNMRIEKEFENAVAKGLRPCTLTFRFVFLLIILRRDTYQVRNARR